MIADAARQRVYLGIKKSQEPVALIGRQDRPKKRQRNTGKNVEAEKLYDDYMSEGFPDNLGLIESAVLVRKHNDARVKRAMEKWMEEFTKYPLRDQFCIMYSLWKINMKDYHMVNGSLWNNQFMIIRTKHKAERKLYP